MMQWSRSPGRLLFVKSASIERRSCRKQHRTATPLAPPPRISAVSSPLPSPDFRISTNQAKRPQPCRQAYDHPAGRQKKGNRCPTAVQKAWQGGKPADTRRVDDEILNRILRRMQKAVAEIVCVCYTTDCIISHSNDGGEKDAKRPACHYGNARAHRRGGTARQ